MSELIESVTVAIITCNRPAGLEKLLSALMQLEFPHFPTIELSVVVVESGRQLEAEEQVARYRSQGLKIVYGFEPISGISYARNHAMDLALGLGEYFAFIDDDEYPDPNWLDALLWCSQEWDAPIVRGPVIPVIAEGSPHWGEAGGFFLRERYTTGTDAVYCACNNVLMCSHLIRESGVRFDGRFALTGGEDTLFFLQVREETSAKIIWCNEAIVMEDIPNERVVVAWIVRRATREGANMASYDAILGRVRFFRLRWISHGLIHLMLALPLWLLGPFQGEMERIRCRRKIALGVGMIRGSFGQVINEYEGRHGK